MLKACQKLWAEQQKVDEPMRKHGWGISEKTRKGEIILQYECFNSLMFCY